MDQHEILSKYTVDQFLGLIWALESEGKLVFENDDVRKQFIRSVLRLFQHDLRVGVAYERQLWKNRICRHCPN